MRVVSLVDCLGIPHRCLDPLVGHDNDGRLSGSHVEIAVFQLLIVKIQQSAPT
jgi:hypothetical protein